jgi:hypothetical protein
MPGVVPDAVDLTLERRATQGEFHHHDPGDPRGALT